MIIEPTIVVIRDASGHALGSIRERGGLWHARDDEGRHLGGFKTRERAEAAVRN